MKKETLQKRIEKHLYTKGGKLAKKYEDVIELLNNPDFAISVFRQLKAEREENQRLYTVNQQQEQIITG